MQEQKVLYLLIDWSRVLAFDIINIVEYRKWSSSFVNQSTQNIFDQPYLYISQVSQAQL